MKKKIKLKKRKLEVVEPEKLEEAPGGHTCDATCPATCPETCPHTCGGTCYEAYTCETDCPPTDCC